jgi:hypothetical protein
MPFDRAGAAEFLARELVNCEAAYRNGVIVTLVDALALCRELPELTPRWVLAAANDLLLEVLNGGKLKGSGRGRTANATAKYRADMVHLDRWSHVKYFRETQEHRKKVLARARESQIYKAIAWAELDHVGTIWDHAYAAASYVLRGTPARGSAPAMKDSYRMVQAELEAGNSSRFYIPWTPEAQSIQPPAGRGQILQPGWRK